MLGSGSFARRRFPGHDVPAHNPSPSLHTDLLTRPRFSRGSQALIPIKTFPSELARVQPAGYSSCCGAPAGPLTGAGSWEAPAEPASGATALGQGSEGAALSVTASKVRENSISWPSSTTGVCIPEDSLSQWTAPLGWCCTALAQRGHAEGQRGQGQQQPGANPSFLLSSPPQVAMDCPTPMVSCPVVSASVLTPCGSTGCHRDLVATRGLVRGIPLPG